MKAQYERNAGGPNSGDTQTDIEPFLASPIQFSACGGSRGGINEVLNLYQFLLPAFSSVDPRRA
jgi:hypothetical protein